mmetsp:Transcript_27210/g.86457  ORF Transcript_27210/g.86457 Transcript_27210/m.86457 type:complete len:259 (+) Transcript_27210:509-1285(+)
MVISSAIAIGRSATTWSKPSASMEAAALGRQEWLCQPRRTESAQPTLAPIRWICAALVRMAATRAAHSFELTPVAAESAASVLDGILPVGFFCRVRSCATCSLSFLQSPTSGTRAARYRSSIRTTEVSAPPVAPGGRQQNAWHSCRCHCSRPAATHSAHAASLLHRRQTVRYRRSTVHLTPTSATPAFTPASTPQPPGVSPPASAPAAPGASAVAAGVVAAAAARRHASRAAARSIAATPCLPPADGRPSTARITSAA